MDKSEDTLLEFPTEFPIKAMGKALIGIEQTVIEIVRNHVDDLDESKIRIKPSRNGNYISVTIVITARSRAQLDAIYMELTAHPDVLMSF
jgi:putative lipoic acid-binding regulatory protein